MSARIWVGCVSLVLGASLAATAPAAEKEITNSIGMQLKLIPAGEFPMGSTDKEIKAWNEWLQLADLKSLTLDDEGPRHLVRITRPFYLGLYHVTRGQFRQFIAASGYRTDAEQDAQGGRGIDEEGRWMQKPDYNWQNPGFEQTDEHPVVNVSFNDAVAFCQWLSRQEGTTYRLPTEAQWEYACRSGTLTRYYNGNDEQALTQVANVADATAKARFPQAKLTIDTTDGFVFTAPVGRFKPNAFGLYDMHGNAWQWCADWYDKAYYASSPAADPPGPDSGTHRVLRGGSWDGGPLNSRSAGRNWSAPNYCSSVTGFRVLRTP